MNLDKKTTVAEMAANSLGAVRVFEKLGIDYCCGGRLPLATICQQKGYDLEVVERELDASAANAPTERDWKTAPLVELITHIVTTHHEYLRSELPAIETRLRKVYLVYNKRHGPTLIGLPQVFAELRAELEMHMRKEEMVLFPAIAAYETAVNSAKSIPAVPFGTVANPIRVMEMEHEAAGNALARIREITRGFALPDDACVTYRALMSGLEDLERDLHAHIHLENNILFPRAQKLEASELSSKQLSDV